MLSTQTLLISLLAVPCVWAAPNRYPVGPPPVYAPVYPHHPTTVVTPSRYDVSSRVEYHTRPGDFSSRVEYHSHNRPGYVRTYHRKRDLLRAAAADEVRAALVVTDAAANANAKAEPVRLPRRDGGADGGAEEEDEGGAEGETEDENETGTETETRGAAEGQAAEHGRASSSAPSRS